MLKISPADFLFSLSEENLRWQPRRKHVRTQLQKVLSADILLIVRGALLI